MKRINILIGLLLLTIGVYAGELTTREKKINRKFNVTSGDKLSVNNRHGKVIVNTWDRNEITVDITIKVKAKSERIAQELIDDIDVEESNRGGVISFKTVLDRKSISLETNRKELSIDYVISMPKKNALDLTNKFGAVSLDDFDGNLDLNVQYGPFTAEKLTGTEKSIKVSFGSANIASVDKARVEVSYSGLTIDKAHVLDVTNKFGKTTIEDVQALKITQRYGDLALGFASSVSGSAEFAGVSFEKVYKNIDLDLKYCSRAYLGILAAGVESVNVNASFSTISCQLESSANLSADIKISFGDLKNRSSGRVALDKEKPDRYGHTEYYYGKIGNGGGKMKMNVQYGDVIFK